MTRALTRGAGCRQRAEGLVSKTEKMVLLERFELGLVITNDVLYPELQQHTRGARVLPPSPHARKA